jgi:hypothetical protein
MKKKIYVTDNHYMELNAGMKAPDDVASIITHYYGGKSIKHPCLSNIKSNGFFWEFKCLKFFLNLIFTSLKIRTHGLLIIQYPPCSKSLLESKLYGLRFNKLLSYLSNNRTILLIHDVNSLRDNKPNDYDYEIEWFNCFKYIILHNEKMYNWLISRGLKCKCKILIMFDYLNKSNTLDITYHKPFRIAVAGNLSLTKAGTYLKKLKEINDGNFIFCLYGKSLDKSILSSNVIYEGVFHPDAPSILNAHFGLVWNGDNFECEGTLGNYLKYNAPHKLSLYLSMGIPVIVWSKSAIANWVIENGIGRTITSLHMIPTIVKEIQEKEYKAMLERVRIISDKVRNGFYLRKVIDEIFAEF